jgi:hypothetical protein
MSSIDSTLGRAGVTPSGAARQVLPAPASLRQSISTGSSIFFLASISIISALLVPSRMLLSTGESDDSSVFAYIGWAMKHGLMPYRDVWDHKGPLLYYLEFVGISLAPSSTFGIGVLELIALSITFFFLYRVITSFTPRYLSLGIAVLSFAFVTHFSEGGNLCESWALLPLAAAHYACWRWSQRLSQNWCAPVIGASFTCIFWLRPNMSAYPAVAMLVMLYASKRHEGVRTASRQLALACAVALAITVLIVAPLYRFGVFREFVGAYFGYNAAYSGALSMSTRLMHTRELMTQLFATGIAILGTAAWVLGVKERKQVSTSGTRVPWLYLQTLLWSLPLETAGASLSGRDYPHYVLPLFPTFAVLAAWFLSEFAEHAKAGKPAVASALLLGLCPFSLGIYSKDFSECTKPPRTEYMAVVHLIQNATNSQDKIVVVGGTESAYITFFAQRMPASRFVYQYALIDAANPAAYDQRRQFMCDIALNRPAVIVSGNTLLGILCDSELQCAERNSQPPVSDYGYDSTLLPKLLKTVIASQYRTIPDPRFGYMKVYLRNDIAVPPRW